MEKTVDYLVIRQPQVLDGMEEMQSKESARIKLEEQKQSVSEDINESLVAFQDVENDGVDKMSDVEGEKIPVSENVGLTNRSYSCPTCRKTFKRKVNLRAHLGTHVTMEMYECSKCDKKFHQMHLLSSHMASHTRGRHKCFSCGKRYRYKRNLIVHQRSHETEMQAGCLESGRNILSDPMYHVNVYMNWQFKCLYCSRGFDNQEDFDKHLATHNAESPYECVLCSAKFSSKEDLQSHRFLHYIGDSFECKVCGKVFKTKYNLERHIICHSVKLMLCEICGKTFSREDSMKSHMMTHDKRKTFYCPKCEKTLEHDNSVKVHLIPHSGDEVCPCHICEFEVNGERQISDNMSSSEKLSSESLQSLQLSGEGKNGPDKPNEDEKQHTCDTCGKTYPERQSLVDHMVVHLQCTKCKKLFKTSEDLDMHLLSLGNEKLLSCCLCLDIFHGKRELHRHLKEHIKAKQHSFRSLSKVAKRNIKGPKVTAKPREEASVKVHVVTHAGKKSLKCSECGRKVHLRHNLEDHLKSNKRDKSPQQPQSGEEFVYISRFGHPLLNRRESPESYCKCNHNIGKLLKDHTEDPPKTDSVPCQGPRGGVGNKEVSERVQGSSGGVGNKEVGERVQRSGGGVGNKVIERVQASGGGVGKKEVSEHVQGSGGDVGKKEVSEHVQGSGGSAGKKEFSEHVQGSGGSVGKKVSEHVQGSSGGVGNKEASEHVQAVSSPQNANSSPKTTVRHNPKRLHEPDEKTKPESEILHTIDGIKIEIPDYDIVIKEEWDVPW